MTTNKDYILKHNNKNYAFERYIYRNKSVIEYKSSNPKMIEVSKPSEIKYNIEDVGTKEDLLWLATPTVSKISTVSSTYFKTQDGSNITECDFPYLLMPTSFDNAFLIRASSTTKLVFKIQAKSYTTKLSRRTFHISTVNNNTLEVLWSFNIISYDDNLDTYFATLIIEDINAGYPNISILESDKFYATSILESSKPSSMSRVLCFFSPLVVNNKNLNDYFDIKNSYYNPDTQYFRVDALDYDSAYGDELKGYIKYKSLIEPRDITPTVEVTKVTTTTKELANTKSYILKRKVN